MSGPAGPTITSPSSAHATVGNPFLYIITSTPMWENVFVTSGFPGWLGLIVDMGVASLQGTPPVAGIVHPIFHAYTKADGPGPDFTLTLTISPGGASKTRVTNIGPSRYIGYLPPHGRFMNNGDIITINGDLRTQLRTRKRYNAEPSLDAIAFDIANGLIVLADVS